MIERRLPVVSGVMILIAIWVSSAPSLAGTYYVSPTGSAGNPGTQPSPWSLSKANSSLVAGDTAILMDGAYSATIQPANNGTPGNRITYQAQNQHMATFNGVTNVAYLVGRTYLTIDGIKAVGVSRWVRGESGNSHITITNCYFANASGWESLRLRQGGDGHVITNNSFINGTDNVSIGHGKNHLVEGNYFDTANHTCMVFLGCEDSIFRYNTLVNPDMKLMEVFSNRWSPDIGKPPRHIFITDNHFKYTGDYTVLGSASVAMTLTGEYIVVRRNLVTECQTGIRFFQQSFGGEASHNRYNRMYHNTTYNCGHGNGAVYNGEGLTIGGQGNSYFTGNIVVNNIFYYSHTDDCRWFINAPPTLQIGFHSGPGPEDVHFFNNDIIGEVPGELVIGRAPSTYYTLATYQAMYPSYAANNIDLNPMLVDPGNYNVQLLPGSPCIDTGRALTATSSGGSGTSVLIADATYFTDGFGLIPPDEIQIGAEVVNIVSVNYGTNVITIDRSISWANGAPVSLPWNGSAPDMGIYEAAGPGQLSQVVGHYVFYNRSAFDGNDPLANAADDGAIAPDKTPLLTGGTGAFANYTSYSRGINGVMVDIDNLAGTPNPGDFEVKVGNDWTPGSWPAGPAPISVTVRSGEGATGSDRVTLIWADNAIEKQWMQLTVKATANTGLLSDDTFYFGNAIGETGNSAFEAEVSVWDVINVRNDPHTLGDNPADITNAQDFNRDRKVGPTDEILIRNNATNTFSALQLITVP